MLVGLASAAWAVDYNSCLHYDGKKCYYDSDKAVQYTLKYAKNDTYPFHYVYNDAGGDCTNFASQVLLAGLTGKTSSYSIYNLRNKFLADRNGYLNSTSTLAWYFKSNNNIYARGKGKYVIDRGPAWQGAHQLYYYASKNKNSYKGMHFRYIPFYPSEIKKGDLIFVNWDSSRIKQNGRYDHEFDHTMIVTKINRNPRNYSDIFVSYHSNDKKNVSL